ncbi:transposase [Streptomyces sp. NPDC001982]|uniref:transposase n=1 Tax=Streptomyces sp. NPDC001982 TaxID=3154405 RepID=UPI003323C383
MLPPSTVLPSLAGLLEVFRPCFRAPTYRVFAALVVGMIAQTGRRTVCGMLLGAGLGGVWHHARAHRFFSAARWSADRVGLALAQLIVDLLVPPAAALEVAVDETFFRRRGKKIFGVLWGHDGSVHAPQPLQVGWGHCWVIAGLVVHLPGFPRPICLPVLLRLWGGKGTASRVQLARTLVELLAAPFPTATSTSSPTAPMPPTCCAACRTGSPGPPGPPVGPSSTACRPRRPAGADAPDSRATGWAPAPTSRPGPASAPAAPPATDTPPLGGWPRPSACGTASSAPAPHGC